MGVWTTLEIVEPSIGPGKFRFAGTLHEGIKFDTISYLEEALEDSGVKVSLRPYLLQYSTEQSWQAKYFKKDEVELAQPQAALQVSEQ